MKNYLKESKLYLIKEGKMKNLCKKPNCVNNAILNKEYCKKHQKELESKSRIYLKEVENERVRNI